MHIALIACSMQAVLCHSVGGSMSRRRWRRQVFPTPAVPRRRHLMMQTSMYPCFMASSNNSVAVSGKITNLIVLVHLNNAFWLIYNVTEWHTRPSEMTNMNCRITASGVAKAMFLC